MKHFKIDDSQTGQIGLVVLLITAVLLTIGVGVASESVTEQKSSRQELESTETFNAADEALEYALSQDLVTFSDNTYDDATNFDGTVNFVTTKSGFSRTIAEGESGQVTIPLVGISTMDVFLDPGVDCNSTASLIVTLINTSGGIWRQAYGPPTPCRDGDGFIDFTVDGGRYKASGINISGYAVARIKAVYNSAEVEVSGSGLGEQQFNVTAQAERSSGEIRAVEAAKGLPAVPSIFDYAVFAGGGNLEVITP